MATIKVIDLSGLDADEAAALAAAIEQDKGQVVDGTEFILAPDVQIKV
jgi:hypothetical protein